MNQTILPPLKILVFLPRAALIVGLLAAPVLAVPAARGASGPTIEAPALKKTGAGLFLLMSLQRS